MICEVLDNTITSLCRIESYNSTLTFSVSMEESRV